MVHHPNYYAELLRKKITRYNVNCWLLNTGWVGGPYGIGKRISIQYTRAMLSAAISGSLANVDYETDPIFGFEVPRNCPGVPDEVLNPASAWSSESDYTIRYQDLAARFIDNFRKFEDETDPAIRNSGPKI